MALQSRTADDGVISSWFCVATEDYCFGCWQNPSGYSNKYTGKILAKTFSLKDAQSKCGRGGAAVRKAIIPMNGNKAGDPHSLAKTWSGGSMYWGGWSDIRAMQKRCEKAKAPEGECACACNHNACSKSAWFQFPRRARQQRRASSPP